ncbi:hypothetical protein [Hymenobacter terricola]|uniref:hypothetical protein n=1 Tax=Hymenobacter terricola TaxID=2819236 RepID=UPI001B308644|nr:hypothetical protein [Hymenobacter terricola]
MKSAAEYLNGHVFEARRPRRELQSVVTLSDAVQAVEQALADAEKYRYLLMRSLRHHANETAAATAPEATPLVPSFFAEEASVRTLFPAQTGRMAA